VRYLLPARRKLETMLRREGRWELAQRCFGCIPVVAELDRLRFNQTFEH
jgi:ribonuclease D